MGLFYSTPQTQSEKEKEITYATDIYNAPFIQTNDKYVLKAKHKYKAGDTVTTSKEQLLEKITAVLNPIFKDDFDWTNIVVAGGLLTSLLENTQNISENLSDIDFFVYGDAPTIKDKIKYICDYIKKQVEKQKKNFVIFSMSYNRALINILIEGFRPIQIIGVANSTPLEIINNFDMTHCQVAFDGLELTITPKFIASMQTRTTEIVSIRPIHLFRMVKAYSRNFSVKHTPNLENVAIINYIHRYADEETKSLPPSSWNSYAELESQLAEIIADPMVIYNLNKNVILVGDDFNHNLLGKLYKSFTYAGLSNRSVFGKFAMVPSINIFYCTVELHNENENENDNENNKEKNKDQRVTYINNMQDWIAECKFDQAK